MTNEMELFDVVELLTDLPKHSLRAGSRGAVVVCHPDGTYEVEFTNQEGETVALCPLTPQQFFVVWRAKIKSWVPLPEQVTALVTHLPERAEQELLNFARFLYAREQVSADGMSTLI